MPRPSNGIQDHFNAEELEPAQNQHKAAERAALFLTNRLIARYAREDSNL